MLAAWMDWGQSSFGSGGEMFWWVLCVCVWMVLTVSSRDCELARTTWRLVWELIVVR